MIRIKKIISILLIIILSLSACTSSETVSKDNDVDSIYNQILKSRQTGNDTENSTNSKQNITEVAQDSLNAKSDNTSLTLTPSWKDLEQVGPNGYTRRSYDEIKEQYPDKTILRIMGILPSDFIIDKLNEYLVQSGSSYVVCFNEYAIEQLILLNNTSFITRNQVEEKMQEIYKLMDIVDIISTYRGDYYELVRRGYLEPWSNYLSTEEGKKLYQSLHKNNWKSCDVDGEIYGINSRADLVYGPPSYIVNKELMNKYNLTEDDLNKPIYELEPILKLVAEGEKANPNFKPISLGYITTYNVFGNTNYLNSAAVTFPYDIGKKAGPVLDEPENLRWLETLCKYANQGLIGKESKQLDDMFMTIDGSTSVPYMIPHYMRLYNKEGELAGFDDVIEIVLDKYYDSCLAWDSSRLYLDADCVFMTSKHKDEAFDFLMKVYTDPYLTNLLCYGIENKTYVMIDGKVEWPKIYTPGYGNPYISYPRNYEYADKKERYWKLYDELPYAFYDFVFDPTDVKEELLATLQVMDRVAYILTGNVEDFDAYIADIRKQLDKRGLQKLIDEVNRQREEWIDNKRKSKVDLD